MNRTDSVITDIQLEQVTTSLFGTAVNVDQLQEGDIVNGKTIAQVIKKPTRVYKSYGKMVPRQIRLSSFIQNNNEGTYLILTREEALTVKDGTIVDNASETKTRALVEVAFKVD